MEGLIYAFIIIIGGLAWLIFSVLLIVLLELRNKEEE